jgi:hypothetical protein
MQSKLYLTIKVRIMEITTAKKLGYLAKILALVACQKIGSSIISRPNIGRPNSSRTNISRPNIGCPNASHPNISRPKISRPNIGHQSTSRQSSSSQNTSLTVAAISIRAPELRKLPLSVTKARVLGLRKALARASGRPRKAMRKSQEGLGNGLNRS